MKTGTKLHLGCGGNIREGWVNLDYRPYPGVDVVRDIVRGLPFNDETFDYIYSENFLEHIKQEDVFFVMNEMWRVLKVGGQMQHLVPKAGTSSYFQDPTHVSHWNNETIKYFVTGHSLNEFYKDDVKGWIMVRNQTSPIHKDLIDFILQK